MSVNVLEAEVHEGVELALGFLNGFVSLVWAGFGVVFVYLGLEHCVKGWGNAGCLHGVVGSADGGKLDLQNAVGEEVDGVVNGVEAGDVLSGLGVGNDVVAAGSGMGIGGKTSAFTVNLGAEPGDMCSDV